MKTKGKIERKEGRVGAKKTISREKGRGDGKLRGKETMSREEEMER